MYYGRVAASKKFKSEMNYAIEGEKEKERALKKKNALRPEPLAQPGTPVYNPKVRVIHREVKKWGE